MSSGTRFVLTNRKAEQSGARGGSHNRTEGLTYPEVFGCFFVYVTPKNNIFRSNR